MKTDLCNNMIYVATEIWLCIDENEWFMHKWKYEMIYTLTEMNNIIYEPYEM